jgi:uncharacterized protein (TIGR03382 family)
VDCGGIHNCFEDHTDCASPPCADKSVVALTSVLYDPATGRIFDADIEINGWDGDAGALATSQPQHGWYFTCHPEPGSGLGTCSSYGEAGCEFIDLRNTVTHEVGHVVGLAHPCGSDGPLCSASPPPGEVPFLARTMSPTTVVGEVLKRDLSRDDVDGVCAIYPAEDGCGCGSGGAGGTLVLLLAAVALRRRVTVR